MDPRRGPGDDRERLGDPHLGHRPHISARLTAEAQERLLTRELDDLLPLPCMRWQRTPRNMAPFRSQAGGSR